MKIEMSGPYDRNAMMSAEATKPIPQCATTRNARISKAGPACLDARLAPITKPPSSITPARTAVRTRLYDERPAKIDVSGARVMSSASKYPDEIPPAIAPGNVAIDADTNARQTVPARTKEKYCCDSAAIDPAIVGCS